jgi:pyrroloquinoline quinone biosynthesis protein B
VQDGGLPHPACDCPRCEAARRDPARRRYVASLAVLVPPGPALYLIDATPDLRAQLDLLDDARRERAAGAETAAPPDARHPIDGVLLTHAHMGHYLGLALFGYEALDAVELPAFCTAEMAAFLRAGGPWSLLVRRGNIVPREVRPGETFPLGDGVSVTPIAVPHRHEYTDTVGYLLRGPRSSLLYVPDTDGWKGWAKQLLEILRDVDVALLDGTFYAAGELPGRDVAAIGHPLIPASMDLLEPLLRPRRLRVLFTHLNHSNPALDPASPEHAAVEKRGFAIAAEGQEFPL